MRFLHNTYKKASGACLLGLLTLPLLAGCGGGGGGNGNTGGGTTGTTNSGTNSGTQNPLSVSGMTQNNLTATLSEPSGTVGVGGTVTYTLTLTNNTGTAIPINSVSLTPTAPAASLKVTGPTGAVSFQPPVPPPPPLSTVLLNPGQSISATTTANGFTAAGVYSATAAFGDDTSNITTSVGPLIVTVQ